MVCVCQRSHVSAQLDGPLASLLHTRTRIHTSCPGATMAGRCASAAVAWCCCMRSRPSDSDSVPVDDGTFTPRSIKGLPPHTCVLKARSGVSAVLSARTSHGGLVHDPTRCKACCLIGHWERSRRGALDKLVRQGVQPWCVTSPRWRVQGAAFQSSRGQLHVCVCVRV